jgi:hypothetical protein
MTTQSHRFRTDSTLLPGLTGLLRNLRNAVSTRGETPDVARRMPGYPETHRGAFAADLLSYRRQAV